MVLYASWSLPTASPSTVDHTTPPPAGYHEPTGANSAPPLKYGPFASALHGVDPMIAVGKHHMIVTQDHGVEFRDATGRPLLFKDATGHETTRPISMSADSFFASFIDPTSGHCINKHANLQSAVAAAHASGLDAELAGWQTDTDAKPLPQGSKTLLINEFYDTRVLFDRKSKRFFILSAARNGYQNSTSEAFRILADRHYYAFAVSISEDPRDGFHQYMVTETNSVDWPRIAVKNDNFIIAHNGIPKDGKPVARVFSVTNMVNGVVPQHFHYTKSDIGGEFSLIPVTQHGTSGGYTLLAKIDGKKLTIYGFLGSPPQTTAPVLKHDSIILDSELTRLRSGIVQRDDWLYITTDQKVTSPAFGTEHRRVRLVRIPINFDENGIHITDNPAKGFIDRPIASPDDDRNREFPAMTVAANGTMVFVYASSASTGTDRPPEARYTVWSDVNRSIHDSVVFAKGNIQPILPGTPVPKPVSYYHRFKFGTHTRNVLDYTTAAVADDDKTVWFTHQVPIKDSSDAHPTIDLSANLPRDLYRLVFGAVEV